MTAPLTPAQRVRRANAALIARGGRRMPNGYLQPDAAQALEALAQAGYGKNQVGVVSRALLDAQSKLRRSSPKSGAGQ